MQEHMPPLSASQEAFAFRTLRDALLQRLLTGRGREVPELPELLEALGLTFPSQHFCLLALRLCGDEQDRSGGEWTPPPSRNMHDIASEYLCSFPGWHTYPLFYQDLFYCLMCRTRSDSSTPQALGTALAEYMCPRHPAAVAVSTEKEGLGGIHDAYCEVLEVLGVIDMQGRENTSLYYGDLDAMTYRQMDTTFERDRRLINCVLEGNADGTGEALQIMEHSGALDTRNTLMLEKRRLLGLINQMTQELTQDANESFLAELDAFQRIMDAPADQQLWLAFRQVVQSLCQYYQQRQALLAPSRALQVAAYIDLHYADSSMGVDQLSEIFKISPSYLSRIFKREIGTGLLPYIQGKRVQQARVLLASTDLRIRDIALRVGFSGDQTFTRTFKSLTGQTPSSYREARQVLSAQGE